MFGGGRFCCLPKLNFKNIQWWNASFFWCIGGNRWWTKMKKNYPRVSSSSLKIMEPFWLTIVIIFRLPDPGFNEDTSSVFVSSPTPASPWTSSSPSQTKLNTPLPWLSSVTSWSVTLWQDTNKSHESWSLPCCSNSWFQHLSILYNFRIIFPLYWELEDGCYLEAS